MRYISALDQNTLERQYKDLMAGRGFTYRKDKDLRGPPLRRLYFEKDNLTVDVTLRALKGKGTEVFMDKYINSEVIIDAKDVLPYMKNPTIELPKYKPNNLSQAAS
ncbi:MAG: hypothetical protein NTZ92_05835, partial [Candidatus Omnitrophica bacterium]|nr:hypothetical protein [Candidatus Omnitrophota bacterium]